MFIKNTMKHECHSHNPFWIVWVDKFSLFIVFYVEKFRVSLSVRVQKRYTIYYIYPFVGFSSQAICKA